jgi:hypothetical protein
MFQMIVKYLEAAFSLLVPSLVTHTWKNTVTVPGLTALPADAPVLVTGDYAVEVEVAVAAGAVSVEVIVGSIDKTKIVSFVINADLAPMDIFTNAADGTGGQHFVLAANKSVAWNNTFLSTFPLPVTQNIASFWLNNASLKAGIFRAGFLMVS